MSQSAEMIEKLDQETRGRLASAQLILSPAAILKELLENSLDASANNIKISISQSEITVIDNGSGIAKCDIALAFAQYSTSKISQFDDLQNVDTFGFRGEALHSIANLADLLVSTRTEGEVMGRIYSITNGYIGR